MVSVAIDDKSGVFYCLEFRSVHQALRRLSQLTTSQACFTSWNVGASIKL